MDAVLTAMDDDSNGEISKDEFLDLIMLGMDKMIEMEDSLRKSEEKETKKNYDKLRNKIDEKRRE